MNSRFRGAIAAVSLVFFVSCASISQETIAAIDSPVQCDTAEQDMAFLQDEKKGGFMRTLAGVTAVLPPGSFIVIIRDIFSAPSGIWMDKWRVAFGTFNDRMDDKINRTSAQCGVPVPAPED